MLEDEQPHIDEPMEAASREEHPKRPHRRGKKALLAVVTLAIIAGLAFGGLRLLDNKSTKKSPPSEQATAEASSTPKDVPVAGELKNIKSDTYAFQISYPSAWTATEKDGVHLVSPDFTYQTTDKGVVTGNFRIYIRQGARAVDGKYIGNGVALEPSIKLVYAQPGSAQRKDTNFTQFGSAKSDHFTFFMVTGDFNLKKDDTLGPNYGHEADTYIILGGYGTKAQTDDLDFSNAALNYYKTTQAYAQAVNIVKSLKLN